MYLYQRVFIKQAGSSDIPDVVIISSSNQLLYVLPFHTIGRPIFLFLGLSGGAVVPVLTNFTSDIAGHLGKVTFGFGVLRRDM